MFSPSKAMPSGAFPTLKLAVVFAAYHFSNATFSGFAGGALFLGGCVAAVPAFCAPLGIKLASATTTSNDTLSATFVFMIRYSQGFGPAVQGSQGRDRKRDKTGDDRNKLG